MATHSQMRSAARPCGQYGSGKGVCTWLSQTTTSPLRPNSRASTWQHCVEEPSDRHRTCQASKPSKNPNSLRCKGQSGKNELVEALWAEVQDEHNDQIEESPGKAAGSSRSKPSCDEILEGMGLATGKTTGRPEGTMGD